MVDCENYKHNLDILDKLDILKENVSKNVISHASNIPKKFVYDHTKIPPLAAAIIGVNNTEAPLPENTDFHTCWTDIDTQQMYLNSKPACYLILNKPGVGSYPIGEAMSKKLNCIHLCPRNLLIDEIDQQSLAGRCLDFNMKHNHVCKFDLILEILKQKLDSPAVKHRGYVISGFPMITAQKKDHYLMKKLIGEESLVASEDLLNELLNNLKKKRPKKSAGSPRTSESEVDLDEMAGEEEMEPEPEPEDMEEEDPLVELPKFILDTCSDIISTRKDYYQTTKGVLLLQFQKLLNLSMKPDIVIYITCPDQDAITKKSHKYYNYLTNNLTTDPFVKNNPVDPRWPTLYSTVDLKPPLERNLYNPKYSCRLPINFKNKSVSQLCNFREHIHSYMESKLQEFDPKKYIKIDGRLTTYEATYHIMEKLALMPVQPVVIPEPLYMQEPSDDMEEFWKTIEESNVIHSGVVKFNRYCSPWFNRCPVELKKRKSVCGHPKYAVMFLKHVYLLSSLDSMIKFCRNPRPYLKLEFLEPTCRVIVTGTMLTGKTMVAQCLAWIFDSPIICYKKFLEDERQKKYDAFAKTILSEIIALIEDKRLAKWNQVEAERTQDLEDWFNKTLKTLKRYVPIFEKLNHLEEEPDVSFLKKVLNLKRDLSFLPFLDDIEICRAACIDREVLMEYAPTELTIITQQPATPVMGDKDVMDAIAAYIVSNELQNDIEPTPEELVTEIVRILTDLDVETQDKTNGDQLYGKWIIDGFPSIPEYWSILSDFKYIPDYTIAILESREIDADIAQFYSNLSDVAKNHEERYLLADDPLIKLKLLTKSPSQNINLDMHVIASDVLNDAGKVILERHSTAASPGNQFTTLLSESIDRFREDWDNVKVILEDLSKVNIEIEIQDKTDVQIMEEVLQKIRQSYYLSCTLNEDNEPGDQDDDDDNPKDIASYNAPQYLLGTGVYCPVAYFDHGILWEGKREFSLKYDNKICNFSKEECLEKFQKDPTKYQSWSKPMKVLPRPRICVVGCIGSGKTTMSKDIAKELGLMHVDINDFLNDNLIPMHFKRVGRQYENSFTDEPFDDENVIDFQMDEENLNLESDIMSNELELRRMVYNYFERGAPILSLLMQKVIKKLWFQEPYSNTGFVLDGYPRLPTDVEDMIACYCMPDLVIELECSSEVSVARLAPQMFRTWKIQLAEAKTKARKNMEMMKKEWMEFITKQVVVKILLDEILDNAFEGFEEPAPLPTGLSAESVIMDAHPLGSSNVDANLFNTFNEMVEQYPEPVDTSEWEKADEVRDMIEARLESIFEADDENIQTAKDLLMDQRIKIVSLNSTTSYQKLMRNALAKVTNLRNRNQSFLEQTFVINSEIAEILLEEGFCFFSKFCRMCPVHILEHPASIQNPYKINKMRDNVFPVLHRGYLYFICGKDSLKKFRLDPIKYVTSTAIESYKEFPMSIAVVGSPKSGKSSLVTKLAKRYGLIALSHGSAIRYILDNMYWTELGSQMDSKLSLGKCIPMDLIVQAVQTLLLDSRTLTYGFIFDGFPESPAEALQLVKDGMYPLIILDLSCSRSKCLENSQNEIHEDILKIMPPYSAPYIEHRYHKWLGGSQKLRDWIKQDQTNVYEIDANESRWQNLQDSNEVIAEKIPEIHFYLNNVGERAVPAGVMCISSDVFRKRMSNYRNFCPICFQARKLKHSSFPVDREGVIQYGNTFYWICADHFNEALEDPDRYLYEDNVKIPEIPAVVTTVNPSLVYENGICIVTYSENLPNQKLVTGDKKFAANYRGMTYLFCSFDCLRRFMEKPHMYHDIVVFKHVNFMPQLSLKSLPNLGYLEQTIGNIITEACCQVNVLRPKYPGLGIRLSGLLHIALYLKVHNPNTNKKYLGNYLKASQIFEARCKLIMDLGLKLRSMDNPLAAYPKCCHERCDNEALSIEYEGTDMKWSPSIVSSSITYSGGSEITTK